MSFAAMAASSRIDRGYHNLSKTISFQLFFRLTFPWTEPYEVLYGKKYKINNQYFSITTTNKYKKGKSEEQILLKKDSNLNAGSTYLYNKYSYLKIKKDERRFKIQ